MSTIHSTLSQATQQLHAHSDSAQLDAEVLLCHCLQKTRSYLRAWPESQLEAHVAVEFQSLIAQRRQGVPVAYLTGSREFWSRNFNVNSDVLIPRPDSELLIEISLALLPKHPVKLLDLGTGSGILAITLAAERTDCQVIATDFSKHALAVAQNNAQHLNVNNIQFVHSNWLQEVRETDFFLIVSNPPYIDKNDTHLQQGDVRFEPNSALISADNGLADIHKIIMHSAAYLQDNGHVLIEHGYDQPHAVQALFTQYHYQDIYTHPDLGGNPRVTCARKPTSKNSI